METTNDGHQMIAKAHMPSWNSGELIKICQCYSYKI